MGVRAAQNATESHAWQLDVVGVASRASDLGIAVYLGQRLTDEHHNTPYPARCAVLRMRLAASSTASMILV